MNTTTPIATLAIHSPHGLYALVNAQGQYIAAGTIHTVELDVDYDAVASAIEEDGWCGTYIDTTPIVVQPINDELTDEMQAFLAQSGE